MPADENWRVAAVGLIDRSAILDIDGPEALVDRPPAPKQGREHRIAVDTRDTTPDKAAGTINKGAYLAISDRPKIERSVVSEVLLYVWCHGIDTFIAINSDGRR